MFSLKFASHIEIIKQLCKLNSNIKKILILFNNLIKKLIDI